MLCWAKSSPQAWQRAGTELPEYILPAVGLAAAGAENPGGEMSKAFVLLTMEVFWG